MKIKIKTFGVLSDIVTTGVVEVSQPVNLENVLAELNQAYPALSTLSFLVFVNGKSQPSLFRLNDQDEVALIPPFAGG